MATTTIIQLFIFLLAGFVGVQTINRIPPLLHTPLMAATNAISGISLVASLVLAGSGDGLLATTLGTIAVACAMTNIVGGFLITDRMLSMFKRTQTGPVENDEGSASSADKS
jgi:H+-translocating NAD(P) transhydrogenase subunit alpha